MLSMQELSRDEEIEVAYEADRTLRLFGKYFMLNEILLNDIWVFRVAPDARILVAGKLLI